MRPRTILRAGYATKKYEISNKDIRTGKFERLINARDIRKTNVNRLCELLNKGTHFRSPLIVNAVNGTWRLIDGNHRFNAIAQYLESNEENRVEVLLVIYDNLTDEEEKDEFTRWNKGTKQNTNDVVKQYENDIPVFDIINRDRSFPLKVTVYGGGNSISFYRLVGAYLAAQKTSFAGSYSSDAWHFVSDAQNLKALDAVLMREFLKDFIVSFGAFQNNQFGKMGAFNALMRIWVDNKQIIPSDKLVNLWIKRLRSNGIAHEWAKMSGRSGAVACREQFLKLLNENRSKVLFVNNDHLPDDYEVDEDE